MRGKLAVIAAIVVFVAVKGSLDIAGGALGIASYIDYGTTITVDRGLYDEEVDGATTDFGMFGLIAGAMLAWRAYHWTKTGKLNADLTREQRELWLLWFVALAFYTALSVLVTRLGLPRPLPGLTKLGIAGGIFYLGRRWYDNRKSNRRWAEELAANLNRNVGKDTPTL
jgi:hypothetical protein